VYEAQGAKGALDSGMKPIDPTVRLAGPAFTVDCRPADNLMLHYAVQKARPGEVLVVDAKGFLEAGPWGDVLTIQAELVDTTTESQLWGEQFRQNMRDLMTVQEEIAWQISEALRLKLTSAQKKKLRKRSTVNPAAYQAYLRGRHHWNGWSMEGFRRALEEFQLAIDLDPSYALAYAGLGDAYATMAYYGYVDPQQGFARAATADCGPPRGLRAVGGSAARRRRRPARPHRAGRDPHHVPARGRQPRLRRRAPRPRAVGRRP
jgi:hypothetical protein